MSKLPKHKRLEYDFPCVTANYDNAPPLPRYASNPLIAALGAIPEHQEVRLALNHLPEFDPAERTLNRSLRLLRIEGLKRLMLGIPRAADLFETLNASMIESYTGRIPFTPESNKILQDLYELRFRQNEEQRAMSFKSLHSVKNNAQFTNALIGTAGGGKTFTMSHIAAMYAPCIHHPSFNGDGAIWQIPFLQIEMPTNGISVNTLAHALLVELHERYPIGNYEKRFLLPRANGEQRLLTALSLLRIHCVGQLSVDEAQNTKGSNSQQDLVSMLNRPASIWSGMSALTRVLIMASNKTQIPLTLVGTAELRQHLGARLSGLRRLSGGGIRPWTPFDVVQSSKTGGSSEFDMLLKALWRYQYVRDPVPLTVDFRNRLHYYSYGIPDIVGKLFRAMQVTAIRTGAERISPELLSQVAEGQFKDLVAVTAGLRKRDVKALAMMKQMADVAAEFGLDETSVHTNDFAKPSKKQAKDDMARALKDYIDDETDDGDRVHEKSDDEQLDEELTDDKRAELVDQLKRDLAARKRRHQEQQEQPKTRHATLEDLGD